MTARITLLPRALEDRLERRIANEVLTIVNSFYEDGIDEGADLEMCMRRLDRALRACLPPIFEEALCGGLAPDVLRRVVDQARRRIRTAMYLPEEPPDVWLGPPVNAG